jgi:YfiH family protein
MASSTKAKSTPDAAVQALDDLYASAGLVRNLRGKAGGVTVRMRMERTEPEALQQPAPDPLEAANGVRWLPLPQLTGRGGAKLDWLMGGFSTRRGGLSHAYCGAGEPGELNLGFTASDERETVEGNRRLFVKAVSGRAVTPLVTLRQIHSNLVVKAERKDARRDLLRQGDGLMTDQPGLLLGIQTADCIPVLVADRKRRVVAAFHAGWRGTAARIVESGIGRMRLEYGCKPENLIAAIGPGIGACCYAVGEEMLTAFESQFAYGRELFREVYDSDPIRKKYPMLFLTQRAPGHSPIGPNLHLDLIEANRRQLLDAGLKESAIQSMGGCTCCQPELFFSHRSSQGYAGRMLSVIGIRPEAASKK